MKSRGKWVTWRRKRVAEMSSAIISKKRSVWPRVSFLREWWACSGSCTATAVRMSHWGQEIMVSDIDTDLLEEENAISAWHMKTEVRKCHANKYEDQTGQACIRRYFIKYSLGNIIRVTGIGYVSAASCDASNPKPGWIEWKDRTLKHIS